MPCVAEVVNRSLKADCTDFTSHGDGVMEKSCDTGLKEAGSSPLESYRLFSESKFPECCFSSCKKNSMWTFQSSSQAPHQRSCA